MDNIIFSLDKNKEELKKFYLTLILMATIGGFLYGYDQSDIGSVLIFIPYYAHANAFVVGYIASGALLGAAIGAVTAAFLTDRYGRKFFLLADIGVYTVGIIISIATINVVMLMVARTIVGFAIGADSAIATAYISEFSPKKTRGSSGAMQQYMIIVGIFLSFIAAMLLFLAIPAYAYSYDWRIILGLAIIPAIIALIIRARMPESPRWLILKRKFEKARTTLARFNIKADDSELEYAYKQLKDESENTDKLNTGAKRALLISGLFMIFYIANGVNIPLIYGPYIISGLPIFPSISNKAISNAYSIGATAILVFVLLIATYAGMKEIDKIGRRKLTLIGFAGMAISDFAGGILYLFNYDMGLLFGLAGYLIFFGIGGGVVAWLIQGEYFPTAKRGFFAAITALIDWVTSFVVGEIFPFMDSTLHLGYSVIIFGAVSVIAFITLYFIMPETKGLTVEEISIMFMDNKLLDLKRFKTDEINIKKELAGDAKK